MADIHGHPRGYYSHQKNERGGWDIAEEEGERGRAVGFFVEKLPQTTMAKRTNWKSKYEELKREFELQKQKVELFEDFKSFIASLKNTSSLGKAHTDKDTATKEEFEKKLLQLEIEKLEKKWWQKAPYIRALFPGLATITVALLTIVITLKFTGYFDLEQKRLDNKKTLLQLEIKEFQYRKDSIFNELQLYRNLSDSLSQIEVEYNAQLKLLGDEVAEKELLESTNTDCNKLVKFYKSRLTEYEGRITRLVESQRNESKGNILNPLGEISIGKGGAASLLITTNNTEFETLIKVDIGGTIPVPIEDITVSIVKIKSSGLEEVLGKLNTGKLFKFSNTPIDHMIYNKNRYKVAFFDSFNNFLTEVELIVDSQPNKRAEYKFVLFFK